MLREKEIRLKRIHLLIRNIYSINAQCNQYIIKMSICSYNKEWIYSLMITYLLYLLICNIFSVCYYIIYLLLVYFEDSFFGCVI